MLIYLLTLCALNCVVLSETANMLHTLALPISKYILPVCKAEDDTPIWLPGERWPTKVWHVCWTCPTGSCSPRYTCRQIAEGGHEHEVVGNGWVTRLLDSMLDANCHMLVLIASGACARYWAYLYH